MGRGGNTDILTDGTQKEVVVEDLLLSEFLTPYSDTVSRHFSGRTAVVYRSIVNPANNTQLLPRKLRKYQSLAEAIDDYKIPSPDDLTEEEKLTEVKHLGTSVFSNEEGLRVTWKKGYEAKIKAIDKKRYIGDMGDSIVRLIITGINDGVLQKEAEIDSKGHYNFLQSKSFDIEDHIDKEYGINGYQPLIDIKDENENND